MGAGLPLEIQGRGVLIQDACLPLEAPEDASGCDLRRQRGAGAPALDVAVRGDDEIGEF